MNFQAVYDAYKCPSNYYWQNNFTDDDIQDAILKVIEKYPQEKLENMPDDNLIRLTFVTCKNLMMNRKTLEHLHVKREYENKKIIEDNLHNNNPTEDKISSDRLEEIQVQQILYYISTKNSLLTAAIFESYALKNKRLCDIAQKIGISYSSAKNHLKSAKKSLGKIMSSDPDDYITSFRVSSVS